MSEKKPKSLASRVNKAVVMDSRRGDWYTTSLNGSILFFEYHDIERLLNVCEKLRVLGYNLQGNIRICNVPSGEVKEIYYATLTTPIIAEQR